MTSESDDKECCGNCRWFSERASNPTAAWGDCNVPLPPVHIVGGVHVARHLAYETYWCVLHRKIPANS